jgi:hypothetical protein
MERSALPLARLARRPFLLISIALHAALAAGVYYAGPYQIALHRAGVEVAASVQATHRARTTRRIEDLQKIKELMEESARLDARTEPETGAAAPQPQPISDDPQEQLAQARMLAKAIDEISRELRAKEQARLTGTSEEEARREVDARTPAAPAPPASPDAADAAVAADEIAGLETRARELLARRAQDLQRRREGVAVSGDRTEGQLGEAPPFPLSAGGGESPAGNAQAHTDAGLPAPAGAEQAGQHGPNQPAGGAALAQKIDDLQGQGPDPARAPRQRSSVGRLINQGKGQIPQVSADRAIKGQGRMFGPGGQYADRIHLDSWYLIGPFPGRRDQGGGATPVYPPEQAVLLDAVYRGKDRQLLRWQYVSGTDYPLIPRDPVEHAVYYGYTDVLMDRERDLLVWLGVDDDATVYLNDRIMWQSDDANKGWFFGSVYRDRQGHDRDFNRTERRMLVRFKKGRNRIFFKLWNDTNEMFFSMVLTLPP